MGAASSIRNSIRNLSFSFHRGCALVLVTVPGIATPWLRGPTVGALLELLEENYRLLLCLAPDLRLLSGAHRASGQGTDLYLDIIDQARYTTVVRLTYRFPRHCLEAGGSASDHEETALQSDPDARLRVCHDAQQVEVLALRQTVLPLLGDDRLPSLRSKWNANWFLAKWLAYCVSEDYRFFPERSRPPRSRSEDSATLC